MNKSYNIDLVVKNSTTNYVTIGGYASVFGIVDSQNDVVVKGAFALINKQSENIKFLWQHDVTKPIGIIKRVVEDDYGLYVEADINSKICQGKEAIELIKQGAISSFSIGFTVQKSHYNSSNQREITEATLWEISIVTFPANNKAQINEIKNSKENELCNLSNLADRALFILHNINSKGE